MKHPTTPNNVIFLDIDGCLATDATYRAAGGGWGVVDPTRVALVADLVARAPARIVIASAWRHHYSIAEIRRELGARGLRDPRRLILDEVTPDLGGQPRGFEIQAWLDRHGARYRVGAFVILDDAPPGFSMAHLTPRLVRTTMREGLTRAHVARALALLAQPDGAETLRAVRDDLVGGPAPSVGNGTYRAPRTEAARQRAVEDVAIALEATPLGCPSCGAAVELHVDVAIGFEGEPTRVGDMAACPACEWAAEVTAGGLR